MIKKTLSFLLFPCILFLIWELTLSEESRWLLPKPTAILERFWEIKGVLASHLAVTAQEIFLSLLVSIGVAFPMGWLMSKYNFLSFMFQPSFIAFQCIPMIALAPLLILWFGWGMTAIVIPSALMIFFPMTITLQKGFSSVPKPFHDLFKLHQANSWQTFWHLQFPYAIPYFFAALRLAFATGAMAAVSGEWVGGQEGLGVFLLEAKRSYDLKSAFAALFVIILLSLSLFSLSLILENLLGKKYAQNHL